MFDELQNIWVEQHIRYEGLFSYRELFKLIDNFFRTKGYEKFIFKDEEKITATGKSVNVKIRPAKQVKSTIKKEIQVWVIIEEMTDAVKDVDGLKIGLSKGKIDIQIDAFLRTDERGKWERRAEYTFIRTVFDKFLYKPKEGKYESEVKSDAFELKNEISSFLNLNKFLF